MAKNSNLLALLEMLQGMTLVNSQAYGKHLRAKRGTYTPITLPQGLKENNQTQKVINRQAQLVYQLINKMAARFKDTKLWPRLLSALRKNGSLSKNLGYQALSGLEIRTEYPSYRIINLQQDEQKGSRFNFTIDLEEPLQVNLAVIVASKDFKKVEETYNYTFQLEGQDELFDIDDLQEYLVADAEGAKKAFKFKPAKKGRYLALFMFEKFENGELRHTKANTGMVLYGF
ncbi:MAG: hypothetical protein EOO99_00325 [Pedobacter sp.]|nr:MAG: hypothetical protein EOO99_00325 [Pedobacter sp.]